MIVIKRITNADEYDNAILRDTCVFHALRRADERGDVDSLGGHALDDLRSKDAVRAALREGQTVLAVYQGSIEMPVLLDGVQPVGSSKTYVAAARILVKLNIGREFDSWVRQHFSNRFVRTFSDAKLVRALILNGIGNDFRTLFNKEKEDLLLKYGINSTDFPELGDNLRGWCSIVKVLAFQPELASSPRSGFYAGVKAEVERILRPTLAERTKDVLEIWEGRFFKALQEKPFVVLGIALALVAALIVVRGCLNANARREQKAEIEREGYVNKNMLVSGSMDVVCGERSDSEAAGILRRDAELHVGDAFKKRGLPWASGQEAKMRRENWAAVFADLREFADASDGEFTFSAFSESKARIEIHPEKVRSFTFDVTALNGDAAGVSEVSRAFEVSFSKGSVVGPKPIRKKTMEAALRRLQSGHKVRWERKGEGLIVFVPDYEWLTKDIPGFENLSNAEIIKKANEFWTTEAPGQFARYPKVASEFEAAFAPMNRDFEDGFEEAENTLSDLAKSIAQETEKARAFLAMCDQSWLRFTAPADRSAKMRLVQEASDKMNELGHSVAARLRAVSKQAANAKLQAAFDAEARRFDDNVETWWKGVAELISVYNRQYERIGKIKSLIGEIVSARERKDFSEVDDFASRVEEAKSVRLAVSKDEVLVAQSVSPSFDKAKVNVEMGSGWAKRMKNGFADLAGAGAEADARVSAFHDKAVGYFCPVGTRNRTLEKALENAMMYADAVRSNHDVKSVTPKDSQTSGTEIDLLSRCDAALASLLRAQRKAAQ